VVILGLLIAGNLGKVEGRATQLKWWTQQQWKASSKGGWPRLHLRSRQWTAGRVGRNFADNDTPAKVPPLLFHRKAKQERSPSTSRREKGTWGGKTFSIVPMRVLTNGGSPPNGPLDLKLSNGGSPPNGPLDVKLLNGPRDVKLLNHNSRDHQQYYYSDRTHLVRKQRVTFRVSKISRAGNIRDGGTLLPCDGGDNVYRYSASET